MRYVCDLWCRGNNSNFITPYGIFFFESDKFPTQEELGNKIIAEVPFLQDDFIKDKFISIATPGGKFSKHKEHHVAVCYKIGEEQSRLYFNNIRPVVEDKKPDKMNLYT